MPEKFPTSEVPNNGNESKAIPTPETSKDKEPKTLTGAIRKLPKAVKTMFLVGAGNAVGAMDALGQHAWEANRPVQRMSIGITVDSRGDSKSVSGPVETNRGSVPAIEDNKTPEAEAPKPEKKKEPPKTTAEFVAHLRTYHRNLENDDIESHSIDFDVLYPVDINYAKTHEKEFKEALRIIAKEDPLVAMEAVHLLGGDFNSDDDDDAFAQEILVQTVPSMLRRFPNATLEFLSRSHVIHTFLKSPKAAEIFQRELMEAARQNPLDALEAIREFGLVSTKGSVGKEIQNGLLKNVIEEASQALKGQDPYQCIRLMSKISDERFGVGKEHFERITREAAEQLANTDPEHLVGFLGAMDRFEWARDAAGPLRRAMEQVSKNNPKDAMTLFSMQNPPEWVKDVLKNAIMEIARMDDGSSQILMRFSKFKNEPWAQSVIEQLSQKHPGDAFRICKDLNKEFPWPTILMQKITNEMMESKPAALMDLLGSNQYNRWEPDGKIPEWALALQEPAAERAAKQDPEGFLDSIARSYASTQPQWEERILKDMMSTRSGAKAIVEFLKQSGDIHLRWVGQRGQEYIVKMIDTMITSVPDLITEHILDIRALQDPRIKTLVVEEIVNRFPWVFLAFVEQFVEWKEAPEWIAKASQKDPLACLLQARYFIDKPWAGKILEEAFIKVAAEDPRMLVKLPSLYEGKSWEEGIVKAINEVLVEKKYTDDARVLLTRFEKKKWAQELMKKLPPLPKTEVPKTQK